MEDLELKALTDVANIIAKLKKDITNEVEFAEMVGRIFGYLNKKYVDEFTKYKQINEDKAKLINELIKEINNKKIPLEDIEDSKISS